MKKRYENANQIRDDIDRYQRKVQGLLDSASAMDLRSKELFISSPDLFEEARYLRLQAARKRRSAFRIRDRKLHHLKEKLSEFMTPPLPNVGFDDRSIQR